MIDITNSAEYTECISQINLWYGSDAQKVIDIANQYELSPSQLTEDWLSGSGFEPWYTSSHGIAGYNSVGTTSINYATQMQEAVNSNAGSVTQVQLKTPVQTKINQQTGKVEASSGLTNAGTGTTSPLTFIQKEVLPAVSAAGLGITLGKKVSKAAYDAGFNWLSWAGVDMEDLNPETWNNITADYPDGALKKAFNTIFGLNPSTGETQQYLDQDAVVYLAQYLKSIGMFDTGQIQTTSDWTNLEQSLSGPYYQYYDNPLVLSSGYTTVWRNGYENQETDIYPSDGTQRVFVIKKYAGDNPDNVCTARIAVVSTGTPYLLRNGQTYNLPSTYTKTIDGVTYNIYTSAITAYPTSPYTREVTPEIGQVIPNSTPLTLTSYSGDDAESIAKILFKGIIHESGGGGIEGITDQDNATLPNFSGCETPADYLNALQTQYPDLFNNAVTQSVVNPDGTTGTKTYIPIGTPSKNNGGNKNQPITDTDNSGNKQSDSNANPNNLDLTGLENLIKTLTDTISQSGTPTNPTNPDPTGTGNTPPVVAPTGNASALWSVYNPSQAELNSFGAWLWSSNFIDQILKLFNNPMQSIIGVHKIFASPPVSGSGSITVGYLNSGVSANLVSGQYTTISCGTVKVKEQFGNVFDYTDTHVRLYLPFIGIVDLDTADVMRGSVSVVYHVDVITGACLAEVKVTRDGSGGTLYQYAGDAAVRYPISSGSYMGVVAGIASAVGGVASAVMTGGATLPLAAGAVAGGISGAQTQVQHSGNFSGNAGAMGGKKPYIIIERPQTMIADGFGAFQGKGANSVHTVGEMHGYFKFSDVHTESISGAAQSEIEAIRAALESGVIA